MSSSAERNRTLWGYGSWRSPISTEIATSQKNGLSQLKIRGNDTWWVESLAAEGRSAVVRHRAGRIDEITDASLDVRTRVHEYGGVAYVLAPDAVYCSRRQDQMLYRCGETGGPATRVTNIDGLRFADGIYTAGIYAAGPSIITVCEDHTQGRPPRNNLSAIDLSTGAINPIVTGADFYAYPRLSPDGRTLAWLCWNHPHMPWDAAELWIGAVTPDGTIAHRRRIAGGDGCAVYQPAWSPDGVLHFVCDQSGWWNIYRWTGDAPQCVLPMSAEFGEPLWALGASTYGFASQGRIVCRYVQQGRWHVGAIEPSRTPWLREIETPYSAIFDLQADGERAAMIAAGPTQSNAIVEIDLRTDRWEVLRGSPLPVDARYISVAEDLVFRTADGGSAFAFFYGPCNPDVVHPVEERPPLIVKVHGGPTGAATTALNLNTQFWTSRGFAVVDVNHRGSSGYGREYRTRLRENWGVMDLEDVVSAARELCEAGRVDAERMVIRGTSSGGYTTLCAITFSDVFQGAVSLYGISDLEDLREKTHKFEAHYLASLVGAWPEHQDRYRDRSPLHFADRVRAPVLLMQGEGDPVVDAGQAERFAAALQRAERPFGLIMFDEDGHGFARATTMRRALEAELDFYAWMIVKSGLRS